jgi:Stress responsive A/B Barrel Domain
VQPISPIFGERRIPAIAYHRKIGVTSTSDRAEELLVIQHTVAFRLNDGVAPDRFLDQARQLERIPGVVDFEVLRQVGVKNDFTHALSMHFASAKEYDGYNVHPEHVEFVNEVWLPGVSDFIELDYEALDD